MTTFDFEPKVIKIIDRLKINLNASSRSEVLRRAIALLNAANKVKKDGGNIVFRYKDGKEQTIIL